MLVSDFDFTLPEELIATHPIEPRDASRMLHVEQYNTLNDRSFKDLPELLNAGDIVVFNDSKVIPARLFTDKGIELLLHKPQVEDWRCFARPARKLKLGMVISFANDFSAQVVEKCESGEVVLHFNKQGANFFNALEQYGHMPLPPYIKRKDTSDDKTCYQTIYAQHEGSVAAPTAGLHFTHNIMQRLREKGVHIAYVTLHVGAGTFQPVKVENTNEHVMHSEYAVLSAATAKLIDDAKANGGRVIAVGTTALRTLESASDAEEIKAFAGETDIFITPGYPFNTVDMLLTNFHLPKSTLFMLVCALCGTSTMKSAYEHAIDKQYRFYSYGDCCLLECAS